MLTGRKPPVVLLHGLAGTRENWARLVPLLRGRVRVPDLPWSAAGPPEWAHGSGAPRTALLDAFDDGDMVVAHSFAANLLLHHLTGDHDPKPSAVVLISPFYRSRPSDFGWAVLQHYLVDFDQILLEGLRAAATRRIDPDLLAEMALHVRDRVGPYGWIRFFESYLRTPTLRLEAIDIPVHLVHGALDTAAPPAGSRALLEDLPVWCRAERTELAGSGHFPMLDEPGVVAAVIENARRAGDVPELQTRKATA